MGRVSDEEDEEAEAVSRDGGLLPAPVPALLDVRLLDAECEGGREVGRSSAAIAVLALVKLGGIPLITPAPPRIGSSWRSQIADVPVLWLRAILSLPFFTLVGGGGIGGMLNMPFTLVGVPALPTVPPLPFELPDPALKFDLEAGRRNPVAREELCVAIVSHARTSSSAICRTRIAGS
jgi:hypothetical protein